MENRLSENVASNVVVSGGVKLKKKRPKNIYGVDSSDEKLDQEFGGEPLDLDLIPGHDNSPDRNGVERPPFRSGELSCFPRGLHLVIIGPG